MSEDTNPGHVETSIEERDGMLVVAKRSLDDDGREAVRREAEVLRTVRHPNIVELVHAVDDEAGGACCMWTELAGRSDLSEATPVDAAAIARLGAVLVDTIDALHGTGWAHGALTTRHCIVGGRDRLTLCSFGSAHRIGDGESGRAAVRGDLTAAHAILVSLIDRLPSTAGRVERARRIDLQHAVAMLARPGAPAQRCVDALSRLGDAASMERGDEAPTESRRARRAAPRSAASSTAPSHPPERRVASGVGAVLMTSVGLVLAGGALWRWAGPVRAPWHVGARHSATLGDLSAPVALAVDLARLAGLVACGYGAVVCLAAAVLSLGRRDAIDDVLARIAPPLARRLVIGAVGLGMVSSAAGRMSATGRPVVSLPVTRAPSSTAPAIEPPTTTTTELPSTTTTTISDPSPAVDGLDGPSGEIAISEGLTAPHVAAPGVRTWTIRPGDHLWRVASETLESHLGHRPASDEIDPYWRALVELNRGRLADPDNPDLVFAGQLIDLPPLE